MLAEGADDADEARRAYVGPPRCTSEIALVMASLPCVDDSNARTYIAEHAL